MNEMTNLAKWALVLYAVSFAADGSEQVKLLPEVEFVKTEAGCNTRGLEAVAKMPEPISGTSVTFACIPPGAIEAVQRSSK